MQKLKVEVIFRYDFISTRNNVAETFHDVKWFKF